MRSLTVLLFGIVLLTGCTSDTPEPMNVPNAEKSKTDVTDTITAGGYVDGLHYDPDSAATTALLEYNKAEINGICIDILRKIMERDQKVQEVNNVRTVYGFSLSQDKLDSLAYYGINASDVSFTNVDKPVYLLSTGSGIAKKMYVSCKINIDDFHQRYPSLFARATASFISQKKPKLVGSTITDQSTKYVDYNTEYQFQDGQNVYIYYTVKNEHQHVSVVLNKSED